MNEGIKTHRSLRALVTEYARLTQAERDARAVESRHRVAAEAEVIAEELAVQQ